MLKCMTAVLLAIELFAASFIQIPVGIVKKEQARSSYSDAVFDDVLGDSSNKDLSVPLHTQLAFFTYDRSGDQRAALGCI